MGAPAAGQVVLVKFPFSDLSGSKLRPALSLAALDRGDAILAQITSNPYSDTEAVAISDEDFEAGSLRRDSFVRPGKLFTCHESLVAATVGKLGSSKLATVRSLVVAMLSGEG